MPLPRLSIVSERKLILPLADIKVKEKKFYNTKMYKHLNISIYLVLIVTEK